MHDADYVYRVLLGMGERGMLEQFAPPLLLTARLPALDRRRLSAPARERTSSRT